MDVEDVAEVALPDKDAKSSASACEPTSALELVDRRSDADEADDAAEAVPRVNEACSIASAIERMSAAPVSDLETDADDRYGGGGGEEAILKGF